jgi:hypothetical protein
MAVAIEWRKAPSREGLFFSADAHAHAHTRATRAGSEPCLDPNDTRRRRSCNTFSCACAFRIRDSKRWKAASHPNRPGRAEGGPDARMEAAPATKLSIKDARSTARSLSSVAHRRAPRAGPPRRSAAKRRQQPHSRQKSLQPGASETGCTTMQAHGHATRPPHEQVQAHRRRCRPRPPHSAKRAPGTAACVSTGHLRATPRTSTRTPPHTPQASRTRAPLGARARAPFLSPHVQRHEAAVSPPQPSASHPPGGRRAHARESLLLLTWDAAAAPPPFGCAAWLRTRRGASPPGDWSAAASAP